MEFWLLRERKGDCSHFMSVYAMNVIDLQTSSYATSY